jgi:copper chaperone CopZ
MLIHDCINTIITEKPPLIIGDNLTLSPFIDYLEIRRNVGMIDGVLVISLTKKTRRSQMKTSITVPDMMCHNCEKRLVGLAAKFTGISTITAAHETHLMEIEFDEKTLGLEQIIAEVRAMGFHPEPVLAG